MKTLAQFTKRGVLGGGVCGGNCKTNDLGVGRKGGGGGGAFVFAAGAGARFAFCGGCGGACFFAAGAGAPLFLLRVRAGAAPEKNTRSRKKHPQQKQTNTGSADPGLAIEEEITQILLVGWRHDWALLKAKHEDCSSSAHHISSLSLWLQKDTSSRIAFRHEGSTLTTTSGARYVSRTGGLGPQNNNKSRLPPCSKHKPTHLEARHESSPAGRSQAMRSAHRQV